MPELFLGRPRGLIAAAAVLGLEAAWEVVVDMVRTLVAAPPVADWTLLAQHWSRSAIMAERFFTGLSPNLEISRASWASVKSSYFGLDGAIGPDCNRIDGSAVGLLDVDAGCRFGVMGECASCGLLDCVNKNS